MNLPSTNTLGSDLSGITNVLCQAIFCQIRMVCCDMPTMRLIFLSAQWNAFLFLLGPVECLEI